MTALQIWLQNHNKRLTQDAIDEALMEYIEKVERENAQLKAIIAEQKEVIERGRLHLDRICNLEDIVKEQKEIMQINFEDQSALIEKLGQALNSKYVVMCGAWQVERDEALAAYELWRAK